MWELIGRSFVLQCGPGVLRLLQILDRSIPAATKMCRHEGATLHLVADQLIAMCALTTITGQHNILRPRNRRASTATPTRSPRSSGEKSTVLWGCGVSLPSAPAGWQSSRQAATARRRRWSWTAVHTARGGRKCSAAYRDKRRLPGVARLKGRHLLTPWLADVDDHDNCGSRHDNVCIVGKCPCKYANMIKCNKCIKNANVQTSNKLINAFNESPVEKCVILAIPGIGCVTPARLAKGPYCTTLCSCSRVCIRGRERERGDKFGGDRYIFLGSHRAVCILCMYSDDKIPCRDSRTPRGCMIAHDPLKRSDIRVELHVRTRTEFGWT